MPKDTHLQHLVFEHTRWTLWIQFRRHRTVRSTSFVWLQTPSSSRRRRNQSLLRNMSVSFNRNRVSRVYFTHSFSAEPPACLCLQPRLSPQHPPLCLASHSQRSIFPDVYPAPVHACMRGAVHEACYGMERNRKSRWMLCAIRLFWQFCSHTLPTKTPPFPLLSQFPLSVPLPVSPSEGCFPCALHTRVSI